MLNSTAIFFTHSPDSAEQCWCNAMTHHTVNMAAAQLLHNTTPLPFTPVCTNLTFPYRYKSDCRFPKYLQKYFAQTNPMKLLPSSRQNRSNAVTNAHSHIFRTETDRLWCHLSTVTPNTNTSSKLKKKLRGLSPRANYTDRAAAAGRRSKCQLLRVEGCHVVSATGPHGR